METSMILDITHIVKKYLGNIVPKHNTELYLIRKYKYPLYGEVVEEYIDKVEANELPVRYDMLVKFITDLDFYVENKVNDLFNLAISYYVDGFKKHNDRYYIKLIIKYEGVYNGNKDNGISA